MVLQIFASGTKFDMQDDEKGLTLHCFLHLTVCALLIILPCALVSNNRVIEAQYSNFCQVSNFEQEELFVKEAKHSVCK